MSEGPPEQDAPRSPRTYWIVALAIAALAAGLWAWGRLDPQVLISWEARDRSEHWLVPSEPDMKPMTPEDPWGRHLVGVMGVGLKTLIGPVQSGTRLDSAHDRFYATASRLWSVGANGEDEQGAGDDIQVLKRKDWPGRVLAYGVVRALLSPLLFLGLALSFLHNVRRIPPRPPVVEILFALLICFLVTVPLIILSKELDWLLKPFLEQTLLVPPILAKGLTVGLVTGATMLYVLHVRRATTLFGAVRPEPEPASEPSSAEEPDTPRPPDAGGA